MSTTACAVESFTGVGGMLGDEDITMLDTTTPSEVQGRIMR
jgi:hypothetical protein